MWTIPSRCSLLAHPGRREQIGGALLEHAGADALLDVVTAAALEHDRLDPGLLEQPAEREAGRARADDADLGAHHAVRSNSAA